MMERKGQGEGRRMLWVWKFCASGLELPSPSGGLERKRSEGERIGGKGGNPCEDGPRGDLKDTGGGRSQVVEDHGHAVIRSPGAK